MPDSRMQPIVTRALLLVAILGALSPAAPAQQLAPPPPPRILVRVLAAAGSPLAGARVRVRMDRARARESCAPFLEFETETRTGEDGRIAVDVPVPGRYAVAIEAHGFASREFDGESGFPIDIPMTAGGTVRGRVLDRGGTPIPRARVMARCSAVMSSADTDELGRFEIRHIPPFSVSLRAEHPDYEGEPGLNLAMADGLVLERDLELDAGVPVSGEVQDESGLPLAGASIRVTSLPPAGGCGEKLVRTGDDGAFTVRGVRPGDFEVRVSAPERVTNAAVLSAPCRPFFVRLERGSTIRGRVRGPQGVPVRGAEVKLFERPLGLSDRGLEAAQSRTTSDGTFMLRGVPDSGFVRHLRVRHPKFADLLVRIPPHIPDAGEDEAFRERVARNPETAGRFRWRRPDGPAPIDVQLDGGGILSGSVTGADDRPLAGARVEVLDERTEGPFSPVRVAGTDAAGGFRFEGLPYGTYEIRVLLPDRPAEIRRAEVSEGLESPPLQVRIVASAGQQDQESGRPHAPAAGATVAGVVLDQDGDAIPRARLQCAFKRADGTLRTGADCETDEAGRFAIPDLGNGSYELRVKARGFLGERRPFTVSHGSGPAELRLVLRPARNYEVIVLDADGQAVDGAFVAVSNDRASDMTIEDAEGRLRLTGLDEGPWSAVVQTDDGACAIFPEVLPGPDGVVRLSLPRSTRYEFRVEDGTGRPLQGASVRLMYRDSEGNQHSHELRTNELGIARQHAVEPIDSVLVAMDGYATARPSPAGCIVPRGSPPVVVRLGPGGNIAGVVPFVPSERPFELRMRSDRARRAAARVLAGRAGARRFEHVARIRSGREFVIQGLAPGVYDVVFVPGEPGDDVPGVRSARNTVPMLVKSVEVRRGKTAEVVFRDDPPLVAVTVGCDLPKASADDARPASDRLPVTLTVESLDGALLALERVTEQSWRASNKVAVPIEILAGDSETRLLLPPGRHRLSATADGWRADAVECLVAGPDAGSSKPRIRFQFERDERPR